MGVLAQGLRGGEAARLVATFLSLDADHDGTVSPEELRLAARRLNLSFFFAGGWPPSCLAARPAAVSRRVAAARDADICKQVLLFWLFVMRWIAVRQMRSDVSRGRVPRDAPAALPIFELELGERALPKRQRALLRRTTTRTPDTVCARARRLVLMCSPFTPEHDTSGPLHHHQHNLPSRRFPPSKPLVSLLLPDSRFSASSSPRLNFLRLRPRHTRGRGRRTSAMLPRLDLSRSRR